MSSQPEQTSSCSVSVCVCVVQTAVRVLFKFCTEMGFLFWELTGLSHCGVAQLKQSSRQIASAL